MLMDGSPPKRNKLGGSVKPNKDGLNKILNKTIQKTTNKFSTNASTLAAAATSSSLKNNNNNNNNQITAMSLYSSQSTDRLPLESSRDSISSIGIGGSHNYHHSLQRNYHPYSYSRTSSTASFASSPINESSTIGGNNKNNNSFSKRSKKNTWGSRERAGMSFIIVIAFFAVFGLIIITELFMIEDKNHGGIVVLRHGNLGSRLGDSMPDYDNVKDDYDVLDANLFMTGDNEGGAGAAAAASRNHIDNKIKMQDRLSIGIPVAEDIRGVPGGLSAIPWGQRLDARIEKTLPHYPVTMKPTDGSWQIVNGTRFKFFVYSAYYDRRDGRMVRVVGATKTRGPEKVWCRLWYSFRDSKHNNKTKYWSATVMARVKIIRENWNLKYSACFILCPLRAVDMEIPQSISVVSRLRAPPGNLLLLRNTDWDADFANHSGPITEQIPDKMAICVKPFHFNYDQALYIMEYLELNTLLGVSHFTFYNHTLGEHATCVLNHYITGDIPGNSTAVDDYDGMEAAAGASRTESEIFELGSKSINQSTTTTERSIKSKTNPRNAKVSEYIKPTVTILPWDLRMRSQKEIRTEGLFAALNDCLYRNMYRYKYLALVDLDEFIMPRYNDTLKDLLNSLNRRFTHRNAGSYSFQNAFFYLQFQDDSWLYETPSNNPTLRAALVTQRKTRRRSKLHPQKQRSKYIARPEAVVEAGNHFVWEFIPGKGSLNVPADAGILHHYRVCEFGGDDCIRSPSVIDRTATKHMKRLLERVELVYNHLKNKCSLPDLPPAPTRPPPMRKTLIRNPIKSTRKLEARKINDLPDDGVMRMKVKLK